MDKRMAELAKQQDELKQQEEMYEALFCLLLVVRGFVCTIFDVGK
jgi:hypothetical protein